MAVDKRQAEELNKKKQFNKTKDLTERERQLLDFYEQRIKELQESRQNVYGVNIEELWQEADRDYVPHKLKSSGRKVYATDDLKGWRGTMVELGKSDDWQFDAPKANPYIKIQTALAILIDRNPSGAFVPSSRKFENSNLLMEQLYKRSWELAKSKSQLKKFTFNLAKYGWAIGRTYPLKREDLGYDDVFRENLDPWNAWIDDMARPNDEASVKDWAWRRVYNWEDADIEFGEYENWKFVKPGGNTQVETQKAEQKTFKDTNLIEVYFYENRPKDLYMIVANGVPVLIDKLPIQNNQGKKRLSCWQSYWTLRHAESPYGIGIYEAIRNDSTALNRIRCMAIDQLTLSIYKMFFYTGTQNLLEEGTIKIAPGVGKQVLDAKNINWLETPGPGKEVVEWIEKFQEDLDQTSGITDPLMGEVTGKTAFEIAQAKEAALKRLKTPLDNICDALDTDGYITVMLMQMLYSVPEVINVTDENLIQEYLKEIEGDPELYERGEDGVFKAKVFREVQVGLEEDEMGNLAQSKDSKFFRLRPSKMEWEGVINMDSQSILTPSEELTKALDLEMLNVVGPLMGQVTAEMMQGEAMQMAVSLDDTTYGKTIKQILKIYKKDPKEWLPDKWLQDKSMIEGGSVIISQAEALAQQQQQMGQVPQTPARGATPTMPMNPQGVAGKLVSGFANRLTGRVKNA